jgi:predicted RNase H-like nuclease (RuvC/YqgF family)
MDRLQQLFWEVYQKNCEIDNFEPEADDLENLKKMSREKLYKNLKSFINSLLDFKKKFKSSDMEELLQRSTKFENIIKKNEADIRTHIARQYQLRIEIESQKNTIDELNVQINAEKQEIKLLKLKASQQAKLFEQFRGNDCKRKQFDGKGFLAELESLADQSKSAKGLNKLLNDRNLNKGHNIRSILAPSKSQREIPSHLRSKSEVSKNLNIVIP